jgi:hypothetical protein
VARPAPTICALLAATAGGACVENHDALDYPPGQCVVEVSSDNEDERLVSHLQAPGQPTDTEWWRDGILSSRWTYAYDAGGRLLHQDQDFHDVAGGSGPDGVADQRRELEQGDTTVTERYLDLAHPGDPPAGTGTFTLDGGGRVTRWTGLDASIEHTLTGEGWLDETVTEALDPETGQAFRRTDRYQRDAAQRLIRRETFDDRLGPDATAFTYAHTTEGADHVVRVRVLTGVEQVYRYRHDDAGRLVRAAVDEDGDGADDWVVTLVHAAGGAITTTGARDGVNVRTHQLSGGCALTIDAPRTPQGMSRPGADYQYLLPAIPSPY